ncbi:MAG: GIY-YIG nuclease family protein [Alphaproteobacteria bacterium]
MKYFVYIMTNKPEGVLYVGVTNDLIRRVYEHKETYQDGFTKKYRLKMLVYYEYTDDISAAIQREKNLKHWVREWKIALIEKMNPQWRDLYEDIAW